MAKYWYSICCGKLLDKNTQIVNGREVEVKGYHCSRCKRPLTVYGNYVGKDKEDYDKEKKEKMKNIGKGYKLLPNGDLELCGKLYKYTNSSEKKEPFSKKYVVVNRKGEYLTTVKLKHINGRMYEIKEPFELALEKEKLGIFRLESILGGLENEKELKDKEKFKKATMRLGCTYNKNGYMV